jgi:transposase
VALWGRPEEDDRLANEPQAIEALCRHLARLAPDRIVVEATGGLERPLALQGPVVNPRQADWPRPTAWMPICWPRWRP